MDAVMSITKALADESRVRILLALNRREELCVCQLIDMLQLAPSTVSKHLFILRNAGLILGRKDGRWMYYRLNRQHAPEVVKSALVWVVSSSAEAPIVRQDQQRLAASLSQPAAGFCKTGRVMAAKRAP